jgi:hypothetical protein
MRAMKRWLLTLFLFSAALPIGYGCRQQVRNRRLYREEVEVRCMEAFHDVRFAKEQLDERPDDDRLEWVMHNIRKTAWWQRRCTHQLPALPVLPTVENVRVYLRDALKCMASDSRFGEL